MFQQTRRTSLGFRGQVEYIKPYGSTTVLPIFEKLFLGGEYSVRGYDIRSIGPRDPITGIVIGGDKSLLFNAEYLITIAGPVRLVLFYDAGQVPDDGTRYAWENFKTSTGRRNPLLHAGAERAVPVDLRRTTPSARECTTTTCNRPRSSRSSSRWDRPSSAAEPGYGRACIRL